MFASYIESTFKPGTRDQAIQMLREFEGDLSAIPGFRHFSTLDLGDDRGISVIVYDTKEAWEAAAPKAQELLGKLAPFFAEMPERAGYDVPVDF